MSALSRFEELVERLVEGTLVGVLGAQVEPVEIARRLARAMEAEQSVGVGGAIAPNDYTVRLHPEEYQRFAPVQRSLERELAGYVRDAARERRMALLANPSVRLESAANVGRRQIQVSARLADPQPAAGAAEPALEQTQRFAAVAPPPGRPAAIRPAPSLTFRLVSRTDASVYPLRPPVVTLGRALDNDVVLEDTRVSRYHAEIRLREGACHLRDLQSTNGSFVNGRAVAEAPLGPDDVVSLGGLELVVQGERAEPPPRPPRGP